MPKFDRSLVARAALAALLLFSLTPVQASSWGADVTGGTLGLGADLAVGINPSVGLRVGMNGFHYSGAVNATDVAYHGQIKVSEPLARLDWFVWEDPFHLTVGLGFNGPKIDATGQPTATGSYTLNGHTYSLADVTDLSAHFAQGHAVAPYLGLGYGAPALSADRLSVIIDAGVLYGGRPAVAVNGQCAPSAPPEVCAQLATDLAFEKQRLVGQFSKLSYLRWYPVISIGLAYRF